MGCVSRKNKAGSGKVGDKSLVHSVGLVNGEYFKKERKKEPGPRQIFALLQVHENVAPYSRQWLYGIPTALNKAKAMKQRQ